jgi:hypothetical protein
MVMRSPCAGDAPLWKIPNKAFSLSALARSRALSLAHARIKFSRYEKHFKSMKQISGYKIVFEGMKKYLLVFHTL